MFSVVQFLIFNLIKLLVLEVIPGESFLGLLHFFFLHISFTNDAKYIVMSYLSKSERRKTEKQKIKPQNCSE